MPLFRKELVSHGKLMQPQLKTLIGKQINLILHLLKQKITLF